MIAKLKVSICITNGPSEMDSLMIKFYLRVCRLSGSTTHSWSIFIKTFCNDFFVPIIFLTVQ